MPRKKVPPKPLKLTAMQNRFAEAYAVEPDQQKAAAAAGYAANSAHVTSCRLMQNPRVIARIEQLRDKLDERVLMDAAAFRKHLQDIIYADVSDVIDDDGNLRAVSQWPMVWRRMISGFDVVELFNGEKGKRRDRVGYLKKIKILNRDRVLEMYGRHVGVQAFKDNLTLTADDELVAALNAGRSRAAKKS